MHACATLHFRRAPRRGGKRACTHPRVGRLAVDSCKDARLGVNEAQSRLRAPAARHSWRGSEKRSRARSRQRAPLATAASRERRQLRSQGVLTPRDPCKAPARTSTPQSPPAPPLLRPRRDAAQAPRAPLPEQRPQPQAGPMDLERSPPSAASQILSPACKPPCKGAHAAAALGQCLRPLQYCRSATPVRAAPLPRRPAARPTMAPQSGPGAQAAIVVPGSRGVGGPAPDGAATL